MSTARRELTNPATDPDAQVSPRPGSRLAEMLSGALRLFRQQGYHATSINDIGAAVGVSGPALYRHFESKDDLLAEAIMAGAGEIGRATQEAVDLDHA